MIRSIRLNFRPVLFAATLMGAIAVTCSGDLYAKQSPDAPKQTLQSDTAARGAQLIKVEVVISRYESQTEAARKAGTAPKRLSSDPYELVVTPGQSATSLRMGSQIPIPKAGGGADYVNIGTNIDCSVTGPMAVTGLLRLDINIEDSSARGGDEKASWRNGIPTINTFRTHNFLMLRDGQTTQLTAVDKATGETVKIDITPKVEKP